MKRLTNALQIIGGITLLILVYGLVGGMDRDEEVTNAAYTAEIMQKAKEDALADARFNELRAQADDMLALKEIK